MPEFSARDVQALRKATGAGMMDAKAALEANDGDAEAASRWLQEKGIAKAAARADRAAEQGAVAVVVEGDTGAVAELRSETDFVAKSETFTALVGELAHLVAVKGTDAVEEEAAAIEDLRVTAKENIDVGQVVRFEAAADNLLDSYLHIQNGRGVNAVLVELADGSKEVAHDIAIHIAFARPPYLTRDEVPEDEVAEQRALLEAQTRNEGKPEQAIDKIVEGKLGGWYQERVLLDQKFVRDEKQKISQVLGDARIVRFAQVVIGG